MGDIVPSRPYVVDFAYLPARLIIEVDGGQHARQQAADGKRSEWLRERGFRVMRFWNNEVLTETEAVLERIRDARRAPPP